MAKRFGKWLILILLLLAAGTGMAVYENWFGKKGIDISTIPTTLAKQGEFDIRISEVGKLDAKKSINVTSNTQGKIVKMVPEGIPVKQGDSIVWLDTSDIEKQIKDGETNLKNAEKDLEKAVETQRLAKYQNDMTVEGAQSGLESAKLDYGDSTIKEAKTQRLVDAQVVPESNLDDAKLHVLSSKTGVEKAQLTLEQAEETRKSNLITGEIQLAQSKAAVEENKRKLEELKGQLKDAVINAPGSGILIYADTWRPTGATKLQEGDQVWQRMNVAQLPDLTQMITKIMVDEIDISRVKIGDDVIVKVDAIPDITLHGKISQIATLAVDKGAGDAPWWMRKEASGVKVFEVTADIDTNSYPLKPGMTTKTDVIVERFPNVVFISREGVFEQGQKKVVYLVDNQAAREKEVKLGKGDGNFVIVENGLKNGDKICLRDPTKQIKDTSTEDTDTGKKEKTQPAVPSSLPVSH
jgi:multidrug resistance efflux pump